MTCSSLRRSYRDVLRTAHGRVRFVHLVVPPEELQRRLAARTGHFMPATLLASQLATLEPLAADEDGVDVPVAGPPDAIADEALRLLRDDPDPPRSELGVSARSASAPAISPQTRLGGRSERARTGRSPWRPARATSAQDSSDAPVSRRVLRSDRICGQPPPNSGRSPETSEAVRGAPVTSWSRVSWVIPAPRSSSS